MKLNYTKKEIKHFLIIVLVLTFVFAFDDGKDIFVLKDWLGNFLKVFLIIFVGYFVHDLGHDMMAKKMGFVSEFRMLTMEKLLWKKIYPKKSQFLSKLFRKEIIIKKLPIGIILALLITLVSNGKLFFAAVSSYSLLTLKKKRLGKKYELVTDIENAKIALAGPGAMLFLVTILNIFNFSGFFDQAIFIFSIIILFDILPLPGLDGMKIFYGSRRLYVFAIVFIILTLVLFRILSTIPSLILALFLSGIIFAMYYYFLEYKG